MKRTLLALIAATFAFAAGSSFAQAPAESPAAPVATKAKAAKPTAKHAKAHKSTTHKVAHKKSGKVNVAHKKSTKTAHTA